MTRKILFAAAALTLLSACSSDDSAIDNTEQRVAVKLAYTTVDATETRAAQNLNEGTFATGEAVTVRISNTGADAWTDYTFTTAAEGAMTAPNPAPYYPAGSQNIDIAAYYPDREITASRSFVHHRQHHGPFGVTSQEWWNSDATTGAAYEYQSKCELGFYDACFETIIDDPAIAENWNKFWRENYGCLHDVLSPSFNKVSYSRALYDRVMEATRNATKPIVLIYGLDDGWTGAAVKDEFINGINVRKYILPAQNHLVRFTSNTDPALCAQIVKNLDDILSSPLTGITVADEPKVVYRKVIENGKIYIIRNNRKYTTTGTKIE